MLFSQLQLIFPTKKKWILLVSTKILYLHFCFYKIKQKLNHLMNIILIRCCLERVMKWLASFIIQNKPTKPWQLAFLPHKYRPLPHRWCRVVALPPHTTSFRDFLQTKQWWIPLSATLNTSSVLPLLCTTPPYWAHQHPPNGHPTATRLTQFYMHRLAWTIIHIHNLRFLGFSL